MIRRVTRWHTGLVIALAALLPGCASEHAARHAPPPAHAAAPILPPAPPPAPVSASAPATAPVTPIAPATPSAANPASNPPGLDLIPDAIPVAEPRSPFGNPVFYVVSGKRYEILPTADGYDERGVASWYGPGFHGGRTSSGDSYNMYAMTAAHKTLPIPCYVRVTNLSNGRSIVVRVNDRGPFVDNRIIDLSYAAATKLDMLRHGTAFVQVTTLSPLQKSDPPLLTAATNLVPAPATAPSDPRATAAPASSRHGPHLYIQVGAYARTENAERLRQQLIADGFRDNVSIQSSAGDHLQRVRLGPIDSVEQYDRLVARLAAAGVVGTRLAND